MMVKDVAFFAYSVRDVPRAIEFYRDVLGLKPGEMFGDHWAEFEVGSCTFGVGNGEPLGMMPGASFGAVFEVDDIGATRDRLIQNGITITEVSDNPSCLAAFASDPEGNKFAIHQRKMS